MTGEQTSTVAALPLAELIWRLSEHMPSVFHRSESGFKYASALGHSSFTAWPEQPRQPAAVQAFPSSAQTLAAALLAEAAAAGWEIKLRSLRNGWEATLLLPRSHFWLTAQGITGVDEFPMLRAVAQVVLSGHEWLAGRLEIIREAQ